VLSDNKVRAILVNVFAGITGATGWRRAWSRRCARCTSLFRLVVRLAGTNVEEGRRILTDSGLPIVTADTLSEAAERVVAARDRVRAA